MATNRVKLEDVINEAKTTLESGNPDRAVALCNHVFKYYPRCLEASRVLGEAYTEKRLLDEAEQMFVFLLSADPQDVLGYVDRGFIAYERSQPEDAIMYYERALELDPSVSQLREELLRLYHEQPRPDRTKIRISKAGLANARLRDGFYGQAIEEYNAVLRDTPNRLDIQVGLLEAYWRNRDYPRAEKLANELLQTHPDLIKANLILWHIYGVRRNQERAATYLEKANALDPLNLIAERLFEDPLGSNNAMRYIEMLGIPSIPAAGVDLTTGDNAGLVPDWIKTNSQDTDVQLGLREAPSLVDKPDSNLGFDLLALLQDTEHYVASQQEEEQREEALGELAELRSKAADNDEVFNLFDEVSTPAIDFSSETKEPTNPGGAFDLNLSSTTTGQGKAFDLFDEIAPVDFNANAGAAPAEPFSMDLNEPAGSGEVKPFDLFGEEEPTAPLDFATPAPPQPVNMSQAPAENDLFDLFSADEPSLDQPENAPAPFDFNAVEANPAESQESHHTAASPAFEPFNFEVDEPPASFNRDNIEDFGGAPAQPFNFEETAQPAPAEPFNFEVSPPEGLGLWDEPEAVTGEPPAQHEAAAPFNLDDLIGSSPEEAVATPHQEDVAATPVHESAETFRLEDFAPTSEEPILAVAMPFSLEEAEPPFGLSAAESAGQPEPELELPDFLAETTPEEPRPDPAHLPLEGGGPQLPFEPALEPAPAPEVGKEAESPTSPDDYLNYLLEDSASAEVAPLAAANQPGLDDTPAVAASSALEPTTNSTPHAFHKRDERGPLPDFVQEAAFAPSLERLDSADSAPGHPGSPSQPQQYQEQENDAMPIKRGPDDENDVFDWEREELPDYLQAFAMDEDEVARAGLTAPNPVIADVNTPPARIRPRDDTGAPGDLPDWLNPVGGAGPAKARGEQIDLTGPARPGSGSLPNWLDATDLDASGPANKQPLFGGGAGGENLDDLTPFSLGDDDGFGGPPPTQPPSRPAAPAVPTRPSAPNPPSPFGGAGGIDDLAPFSFGDDGPAPFGGPATPPPSTGRAPSPFGGSGPAGFEPPSFGMRPQSGPATPPPADDFGFGGDDLIPFSLDDNGPSMNPPRPPSEPPTRQIPPRQTPPAPAGGRDYTPSMPQPSFMPPDDMGDLAPFSFGGDDSPFGTPPAPPSRQATPPTPQSPTPSRGQEPAGFNPFGNDSDFQGMGDLGMDDIAPFSLGDEADFGSPPTPPPAPRQTPPATPSFGNQGQPPRASGGGLNVQPSPFGPIGGGQPGGDFDDEGLVPFDIGGGESIFSMNPNKGAPSSLGLDPVNPFEPLDSQPFRPERRNRREEEAEPSDGQALISRGLKDRITSGQKSDQQGPSLFEKLKQRRQEQDKERVRFTPPTQPGDETDPHLAPFDEVERQAQYDTPTPPSVRSGGTQSFQTQPQTTSPYDNDFQPDAFDLTEIGLGLDNGLDYEPFDQSLDMTLPSTPGLDVSGQPANVQDLPEPGFDFQPFDLDTLPDETVQSASTPVEPTRPTQPVTPPAFDFAQADLTDEQFAIGEDFTFSGGNGSSNDLEPATFDFGEPVQPVTPPVTNQRPVTPSVPQFDFNQTAPVEPIFSLPDEPIAPVVPLTPTQRPVVPTTPVQRPVTDQVPTPPPVLATRPNTPTVPAVISNGNGASFASNLQAANEYFEKQDYSQSINHFNNAIKAGNPEELKNVVERLKQIVTTEGVSPRYHRVLGDAYKKQGLYQAALSEYSKALGPAVGARK